MAEFIECTSLNISFDIYGIATVSFTIISDDPGMKYKTSITAGNQTFDGYVNNISYNQIQGTAGWFESHVTLICTVN